MQRAGMSRTFVFVLIFLVSLGQSLRAQNFKERLNNIIRETQKQGTRAGRLTLVWWLPPEFWRSALQASGTVPADKVEEMVAEISDVNVFVVVDAKMGALGVLTFEPQTELEKNLSITDPAGKTLALIPEEKQTAATKNLLAIMKPLFANMIGELGKNLSCFVYEGKTKSGARHIDPTKPGLLAAKMGSEEFKWRLPLGSLLPAKVCPKCDETFPGNYAFCPYDASPLQEKGSEKK